MDKDNLIMKSRYKKTFILFLVCLFIPFLLLWLMIYHITEDVFLEQKSAHLMSVARIMDTQIPEGGYDEMLREAGAEDVPDFEKINILNEALLEITDKFAGGEVGMGTGYYSKELDAIITYGPSDEFGFFKGSKVGEEHPGRVVMETGIEDVQMGAMVRGEIMNAMFPIIRNDEVIGYIWTNQLISTIEAKLKTISTIIKVMLLTAYFAMDVIVAVFIRKTIVMEKETTRRAELIHIVNHAVTSLMATDEDSFGDALAESMKMLAEALVVDWVSIWKAAEDETEFYKLASWEDGDKYSLYVDTLDYETISHMDIYDDSISQLRNNKPVWTVLSSDMMEELSEAGEEAIKSFLAMPVFLHEHFWGFVGYANKSQVKEFTDDEKDVLSSGSILMSNAIFRNEMMKRLVKAKEEALKGTRAKSAFLASMSHEIRTPMNAILGMAAIGKKSDELQRKDYAFDKIEDASVHLLGVINDVLDFSKIESGKLEISPEPFEFEDMLRRVMNVVMHKVDEKKQGFELNVDENIPSRFDADGLRISQVITNLLSNAIKFTPEEGEVSLSVYMLEENDDVCTLQFDVKDNGIGIDKDNQDKIFKSFEQAESTTTRKFGGTGLGLSISKNIVGLMGGEIWVESVPGEGSCFSFTIKAKKTEDAVSGEEGDDKSEEMPDFSGKKILLVEDIEINREIFIALIEPSGLEIECAENGVEAVEKFSSGENAYDLIFMDIQMPEMDGFEATRRIRALEQGNSSHIPIVAMTANVFKEDIEACHEAGMDDHLGKPLVMSAVIDKLNKYLEE